MGYNSKHLKVRLPKNTVTKIKIALGTNEPTFPYENETFYGIVWDILSQLNDADYNGMVPLNWEVLRNKYTKGTFLYNDHLDYLLDNDIIITNGHFKPHIQSKHYKLVAPLIRSDIEIVYLSMKSSLGQYMIKSRKSQMDTIDNLKAKDKIFLKKIRDKVRSTDIDSEKARAFVNHQNLMGNLDSLRTSYADDYIDKFDKENRGTMLLFKRKMSNLRLYDSLTNIPHYLKQFILADERLVQLDLSNSQPLLANIIFEYIFDSLFNSKNHLINKHNESLHLLFRRNDDLKRAITLTDEEYKNTKSYRSKLRKEIDKYKELTASGNWYKYLSELYNKGYNTDYFDKNIAKGLHMIISFSKCNVYRSDKKIFKSEFPLLHKLINHIKSGTKIVDGKEESNHGSYAILLQKIESKIFIDGIAKDLIEEHNIVPYTQHDSITVEESEKAIALAKTEEVLFSVLGLQPSVQEDYWDEITTVKDKKIRDKREYKERVADHENDKAKKKLELAILEPSEPLIEAVVPSINIVQTDATVEPEISLHEVMHSFFDKDPDCFMKLIGKSKLLYDKLLTAKDFATLATMFKNDEKLSNFSHDFLNYHIEYEESMAA
jgi:hypothetical protein